jgi:putative ABC transport system permease protein
VLQVRTSTEPTALAPAIERAIWSLESGLPLFDVQSMTQALGGGLGFFPVRVAAAAAATLGLLAFALAIVGLYGVISYLAGQRRHEIGVQEDRGFGALS